jgi:hypothetical protein
MCPPLVSPMETTHMSSQLPVSATASQHICTNYLQVPLPEQRHPTHLQRHLRGPAPVPSRKNAHGQLLHCTQLPPYTNTTACYHATQMLREPSGQACGLCQRLCLRACTPHTCVPSAPGLQRLSPHVYKPPKRTRPPCPAAKVTTTQCCAVHNYRPASKQHRMQS